MDTMMLVSRHSLKQMKKTTVNCQPEYLKASEMNRTWDSKYVGCHGELFLMLGLSLERIRWDQIREKSEREGFDQIW
jgi:hypothetical protein